MRGKLASRDVLYARLSRNGRWGLLVIIIAMAVGMAGYMFFGGMNLEQAFANAAMILSGMGPLDKLDTSAGLYFEGIYALASGLIFFAVAGLVLSPLLHRILHSFHLEDEKN
jgi:TRAP-type C4-dicarboxylate transport system permease small subunit